MHAQPLSPLHRTTSTNCTDCRLHGVCWPQGLDRNTADALSRVIHRSRTLEPGTHLFQQGAPLTSLFVVVVGSVKNYVVESDGMEQIVSFCLPGELLGVDAIEQGRYASTAETLESTVVCELPYARFENACAVSPGLRASLLGRLSSILVREHRLLLGIAQRSADARLAMFLLSLSNRLRARGLLPTEFSLSMTRRDLANFLALSSETVSRILRRLQDSKLVTVNNKHIVIHDMDRLQTIANDNATVSYAGIAANASACSTQQRAAMRRNKRKDPEVCLHVA